MSSVTPPKARSSVQARRAEALCNDWNDPGRPLLRAPDGGISLRQRPPGSGAHRTRRVDGDSGGRARGARRRQPGSARVLTQHSVSGRAATCVDGTPAVGEKCRIGSLSAPTVRLGSGVRYKVKPHVQLVDGIDERDRESCRFRGSREARLPMRICSASRRPRADRSADSTCVRGARGEDIFDRGADVAECRLPRRDDEVAQQQQVDDVSGTIVDGGGWVVRVGAGMDLLSDLVGHRKARQGAGARQAESGQGRRGDRLRHRSRVPLVG